MKRIASLLALVAAVAAVAVPAASADKVKSAVSWHSVAPASTDGARW